MNSGKAKHFEIVEHPNDFRSESIIKMIAFGWPDDLTHDVRGGD